MTKILQQIFYRWVKLKMTYNQLNDGIFINLWIITQYSWLTLQWSHNGSDGVSNHRPRDCLLNPLFKGADERKHLCFASLAFVRGIRRRPGNSPHKGPVTREMIPFYDVIMYSLPFLDGLLQTYERPKMFLWKSMHDHADLNLSFWHSPRKCCPRWTECNP